MFTKLAKGCLWIVLVVLFAGLSAGCGTSTPTSPTPTTQAVATIMPTATPTVPSPITVPTLLVVANTGGDGVVVRRVPATGDIIRGWLDGTPMLVVGEDKQVDGKVWKNVKDPLGNVGWVAAEYLAVPPMPTPGGAPSPGPLQTAVPTVPQTKP